MRTRIGRCLIVFALGSSSLFSDSIGFEGQNVSLAVYYPDLGSPNVVGFASATVQPNTVTFPNIAGTQLAQPGVYIVNADVTLSGNSITFNYPASEAGTTFAGGVFNGYVFYAFTPENTPAAITGVSLFNTNLVGLTQSSLSFSANTINVNVTGDSLPSSGPGIVHLGVNFASPPPPGPPPQLLAPLKTTAQTQYYKKLTADYAAASALLIVAAGVIPPCFALCGAAGAVLAAESAYFNTIDPVDLNYTVIAKPSPPSSPPLPNAPFLTPAAMSLFDDIQNNSDQLVGLANAAQTSLNRASGAFVNDDAKFESLQLEALNMYISQEMMDSSKIGNDFIQLSELLPDGAGFDKTAFSTVGNQFLTASNETPAETPEPSSLAMISVGLAGIIGFLRIHRHYLKCSE